MSLPENRTGDTLGFEELERYTNNWVKEMRSLPPGKHYYVLTGGCIAQVVVNSGPGSVPLEFDATNKRLDVVLYKQDGSVFRHFSNRLAPKTFDLQLIQNSLTDLGGVKVQAEEVSVEIDEPPLPSVAEIRSEPAIRAASGARAHFQTVMAAALAAVESDREAAA